VLHRLKDIQLQILHCILEKIPTHPAVHGFFKGRSIKTFVSSMTGSSRVL
jgi:RNA-directed DNA polymerase